MHISDWSSDVCSSDLRPRGTNSSAVRTLRLRKPATRSGCAPDHISSTEAARTRRSSPALSQRMAEMYTVYNEGVKFRLSLCDDLGFRDRDTAEIRLGRPSRPRVNRSEVRRVGKEWVSKCGSRW